MANWRELYNRVKSVNIEQIFQESIISLEPIIIDTLTTKQLELGINGENKLIGAYKSESYAEYKKNFKNSKAPAGYADLKNECDWYSGLHIEKIGNGMIIKSYDSKDSMLTKDWGVSIKGLTDKHTQEIGKEYLKPEMLKRIRNAMQL